MGKLAEMPDSQLPPTLRLETGKLPWETQIDEILAAATPDPVKAHQLFALLAKAPPEAWERIAEEAIQRVPNETYGTDALPRLINPQTNGRVLSILFADLMERPETTNLPALLTVARLNGHPYAEPARDNLEHALGHDYQTDWAGWEKAIRQRLLAGKAH